MDAVALRARCTGWMPATEALRSGSTGWLAGWLESAFALTIPNNQHEAGSQGLEERQTFWGNFDWRKCRTIFDENSNWNV